MHTFGAEHFVEGAGELGVAVVDQEAYLRGFLLYIEVPYLLGDKQGVWARGGCREVEPARIDLNEKRTRRGFEGIRSPP